MAGLGVRIQDVTPDVAEAIGLEEARGALVTDVPEGPSKEAGILAGDVILTFDGTDVQDTRELVSTVANAPVGKAVRVIVHRDEGTQTLLVTLGRREDAEAEAVPASAPADEPINKDVLGLSISPVTDDLRSEMNLADGLEGLVVTEVGEDTEAFEKGVRAGDVITEAGQQPVASVGDLEARIEDAREAGRKSILLLVRRDGDPRFVALSLDG